MLKPTTPPPPKEALEYLRAKGYQIGWDYRDVWKEEHVRAFTVAKAMTQDLLIDIRKAVDTALADGKTFKQFKDELEPLLGKRGWLGKVLMEDGSIVELGTPRRLKIIYDTNLRVARTAGQWERIQNTKEAMPYLQYGLGPSKEHRLQHVDWDGLILPADHPFWDTHMPPNGWGCKCRVRQLTERQASQRGGVSEPPEQETTLWENKRTGKVEEVPVGIDPGWDYNPGKAKLSKTEAFGREKEREFQSIVGTADRAIPKQNRIVPSAMSSMKNISVDDLEESLKAVPGADRQLQKLQQFTEAKGVKTLVIRQSEMGARNKASLTVREKVLGYLDENQRQYGHYNYTIRSPAKTGGFTNVSFNHIVVKGNAKINFKKADYQAIGNELSESVEKAALLRKAGDDPELWALAYGGSKEAELIATWVHEMGHQLHYWAGSPRPPTSKRLTRYSKTNHYEYHAEHFSAWLFNREALERFDPEAAKHFDELLEKAIEGKQRSR